MVQSRIQRDFLDRVQKVARDNLRPYPTVRRVEITSESISVDPATGVGTVNVRMPEDRLETFLKHNPATLDMEALYVDPSNLIGGEYPANVRELRVESAMGFNLEGTAIKIEREDTTIVTSTISSVDEKYYDEDYGSRADRIALGIQDDQDEVLDVDGQITLGSDPLVICYPGDVVYIENFRGSYPILGEIPAAISGTTYAWALHTDAGILVLGDMGGTAGGGGEPGVRYVHTQGSAATTWTITHNLGFFPQVSIKDSAGDIVFGNIHHNSNNQAVLTFSAAFSGVAYLS